MKLRIALAALPIAILTASMAPSTLELPNTTPLSADEIPATVEGGPYALTIYDGDFAGTTGQSTWDFSTGTVSGSFETTDGQTGTFSNPASIEGNKVCSGDGTAKQCHFVYPYKGGFLEVNDDGSIHAASLPI